MQFGIKNRRLLGLIGVVVIIIIAGTWLGLSLTNRHQPKAPVAEVIRAYDDNEIVVEKTYDNVAVSDSRRLSVLLTAISCENKLGDFSMSLDGRVATSSSSTSVTLLRPLGSLDVRAILRTMEDLSLQPAGVREVALLKAAHPELTVRVVALASTVAVTDRDDLGVFYTLNYSVTFGSPEAREKVWLEPWKSLRGPEYRFAAVPKQTPAAIAK